MRETQAHFVQDESRCRALHDPRESPFPSVTIRRHDSHAHLRLHMLLRVRPCLRVSRVRQGWCAAPPCHASSPIPRCTPACCVCACTSLPSHSAGHVAPSQRQTSSQCPSPLTRLFPDNHIPGLASRSQGACISLHSHSAGRVAPTGTDVPSPGRPVPHIPVPGRPSPGRHTFPPDEALVRDSGHLCNHCANGRVSDRMDDLRVGQRATGGCVHRKRRERDRERERERERDGVGRGRCLSHFALECV